MQPPKVVVEPSANHLGDIQNAIDLIAVTKSAGADYIKWQCYVPDSITIDSSKDDFILKDGPWKGRKLWDLYAGAHTPREWFPELIACCKEMEVKWFASVFSPSDVDFLEKLGCPMYKIASYEIVDIGLIKHAAKTGKPLVISTGMASWDEISAAVYAADSEHTTLLHCVSGYPTGIADSKLRSFVELRFNFPFLSVGVSDHSLGTTVATAATALGAEMIEKHVCLDRKLGGEDAHFSMEPHELKEMVEAVRGIYTSCMETPKKDPEGYSRQQRRSLYAVKDIAEGEVFTEENIRSIRPGYGLPPNRLKSLLGTKSPRAYSKGDPLT